MKEKKEWFDDWFDTAYYHLLYRDRDYKEAENFISRLSAELRFTPSDILLDMACGKGRHSIYLNKLGFNVTGVDLSEQSILSAKQHENERLRFATHDMREPYGISEYDYVLNLFTSFGYFEEESDNLKAIMAMSKALKQEGILVLDFLNAPFVIDNLVEKETKTIEGIDFNIRRVFKDGWITKHISFEDKQEQFYFFERVKAISKEQFEAYFAKSGLSVLSVYGNYELDPYQEQQSDRLIFVVKKL